MTYRDTWLFCDTCSNVLEDDECALCGVENADVYTITGKGFNHFLGPFCDSCWADLGDELTNADVASVSISRR